MTVETKQYDLIELMRKVDSGEIQLPDFQREWKWDDDRIIGLLASILASHPIGVLMLLEVDEEKSNFAATPLAGVKKNPASKLNYLLLDGQQRLTSLYQALYSDKATQTFDGTKVKVDRWYYLDIEGALKDTSDFEEAIKSVPGDLKAKKAFGELLSPDLFTQQHEIEEELFPLSKALRETKVKDWMLDYAFRDEHNAKSNVDRWQRFEKQTIDNIKTYRVPVIVLKKDTPKEAVCKVFERVNTGGVPLNVFELLTAMFASSGYPLKDDWRKRNDRLKEKAALRSVKDSDFLQVIALLKSFKNRTLHTGSASDAPGISCKRRDILELKVSEYEEHAEEATKGFIWAASFLAQQGIFNWKDLPYRTQLVPLAALRATLGQSIGNIGTFSLISQWYWCGVFGELYRSSVETLFSRDLEQVVGWVNNGNPQPATIGEANFNSSRLLKLGTRTSAAYKGLHALLIRSGCMDWQKNQRINEAAFFDYSIDIHHIFPKKWCKAKGIERYRYECIVNKTAISSATNRKIGGKAPSAYLPALQKEAGISETLLDNILDTHAIDGKSLRADDFGEFFALRRIRLLDMIEEAMGKSVNRDDENTEGILKFRQNYPPFEA